MKLLNGGFNVKIYFITSKVRELEIKKIKNGIVFSFIPLNLDLKVPVCVNDYPNIEFRNIKNGTIGLNMYQEERIRKLFWHNFNRYILWTGNRCVDKFTKRNIKREEILLEGSFTLTKMLEVYRKYYCFYASFFFLYFFTDCTFNVDFYSPVRIRFFNGIVEELELWEAITIHAVTYSMSRDLLRNFYEDVEYTDYRTLVYNLLGYFMYSKSIWRTFSEVKNLLESWNILRSI